jgi:hypothetical protein
MIKTNIRRGVKKAKKNCKNKKKHTEHTAKWHQKIMQYKGDEVYYYQCTVCGQYHITRQKPERTKKKQEFIRKASLIGTKNADFIVRLFKELQISVERNLPHG